MPKLRLSTQSFANLSMVLSIVSGALSLFFFVGDSKPFIVLTSAPPLSMIAGIIATAAIAYESIRRRTVSTRCVAAFALAVVAYSFSDFVIRDYANG